MNFKPFELPKKIIVKCIELVKELGLGFGAIDLVVTPENEYYFLEVNPNGQWAWVEFDTGLPISEALIKLFYDKK